MVYYSEQSAWIFGWRFRQPGTGLESFTLGDSAVRPFEQAHLAFEEGAWRSRTTKTDIIVVIRRVVVVAVRHAQVVIVVVPTAPAQHPVWPAPTAILRIWLGYI